MVDLLSPTGTSFVVHDGKKVYAGPCEPNSVKVLHWAKPKPKPKVPAAQVGAAVTTAGHRGPTLALLRGRGGRRRLRARDDRPGHGRPRRSHGAHHADQPGIGEYDPNASAAYGAMQDEMAGTRFLPGPPEGRRWPLDPYAAMDAATDPYAAVPDAGAYDLYAAQDAAAAPMDAGEAYDPDPQGRQFPPSSSYLDQWKNKRKNIFDDDAMNS